MDRRPTTAQSELECVLFDESVEPKALPLSLLEHITNGFSDDKEIGYGGFARVYKGMLDNGIVVAVKKLLNTVDIDEKKFIEEVSCLMKAKQKNIVRFLGYCSDTQGKMLHYEGKLVLAEVRQRLLCFEYLPIGSLDKKITDASRGLEWSKRYKIITGICDGLYYLHQKRILHLDLKPSNILLDDNMMPKIADFGLSRCFDEEQSRAITSKLTGTLGYLAPEFIRERQITFKSDIYSLGIIIIEMLTGEKGYPNIDNVLERWRSRLDKTQGGTQLVQVRICTEIGIQCTDSDPVKRPDTEHIVDRLGATKSVDESATETEASSSSMVAQVRSDMTRHGDVEVLKQNKSPNYLGKSKYIALDPSLELCFHFEPNKDVSCCLQLFNKVASSIAFNISIDPKKYRARPNKGILAPSSIYYIILTLAAQTKAPRYDMVAVQSTRVPEGFTSEESREPDPWRWRCCGLFMFRCKSFYRNNENEQCACNLLLVQYLHTFTSAVCGLLLHLSFLYHLN